MVARRHVATLNVDRLHISTIEHMVDAEIEAVAMIGYGGSEGVLSICVMHVVALDSAHGIAALYVVEVTGHDEVAPYRVDGLTDETGLVGTLVEGNGEFVDELVFHILELLSPLPLAAGGLFKKTLIKLLVGHAQPYRLEMHIEEPDGVAHDVKLEESHPHVHGLRDGNIFILEGVF